MNYIILNHYIQVYFYDRSHFLRQIILFCAFLFAGNDTNRQLRTVWVQRTKRNKDTNTVCILAQVDGAGLDPPGLFFFRPGGCGYFIFPIVSLTSISANPRILPPVQFSASKRPSSFNRTPQAQFLSDPAHSTRYASPVSRSFCFSSSF